MSTFSVFRKNQKTWLAVLGVLTMLSFVFIPTLEQCGRFVPGNQAYFKTKAFGNLSSSQFEQESRKLQAVLQFTGYPALNEHTVAFIWLEAKYAEKFGFVVSDEEIRDFINKAFSDSVEGYYDTLKEMKLTPSTFEDGVKEFLLAEKYQKYCLSALPNSSSPYAFLFSPFTIEQQWQLFSILYRNATINVIPVRAEDFLSKVSSPTKKQIKAFFEANKKHTPNKKQGIVGFKSPEKMRIQYLVYQNPVISDTPAPSLPELPENINLEETIPTEAAPTEAAPAEAAPAEAAPAEAAPAEAAPAEAAPTEAAPTEAAPTEAAPTEAAPAEAAPTEAAPAEAAPAEAAPAEAAPAEAAPSADARSQSPFRLVADEVVTTEAPAENAAPQEVQLDNQYDSKAFQKLVQTDLSNYSNALSNFEFSNDKNQVKPEFEFSAETKAYMEKCGIKFVALDLMDLEELANHPISKTQGFEKINTKPFIGIECSDAANQYIVWNAEYIPEEEPRELTEEIIPVVEKAWKLEEAKKLAAEAAQKSAEDCAKANALSGVTAPVEIENFARFKPIGSEMNPVNLSIYDKLENVGEDFREGVFQMMPGEIKAFPNRSHTVFYVTQLKSFEPNNEDLCAMFKELKSNPDNREMLLRLHKSNCDFETQNWWASVFEDAGASFTYRGQEEE